MRIEFNTDKVDRMGFSRVLNMSYRAESMHWARILRQLREESPWKECSHSLEDEKFHAWLKETWIITPITTGSILPGYISAIDVDDATYTLLLLRFPKE